MNQVSIQKILIEQEDFYKISNSDLLRPFFMSVVSDSNHWMFISSNGGISAGRKDAENALFPYYTDDKITESTDITGNKSIFIIQDGKQSYIWEPFSYRYEGMYKVSRNLYKNTYGNKIIFEEINHDFQLTFRYQWNSSKIYGFIKKTKLINNGEQEVHISVLDGIQNIMPSGVGSYLQSQASNLVDAYKRSELVRKTGMGIFALSAIIVDKAEPSEALKANIAWSIGLDQPCHLLSSLQLKNFRKRMPLEEETDIKAEKGAYFLHVDINLKPREEKEWWIITNVNQTHSSIAQLNNDLKDKKDLARQVQKDIDAGTQHLIELNAAADGLQLTADPLRDSRHFSNTLFNIMRGGIFDNNYLIEKWDIINYLSNANIEVAKSSEKLISNLPEVFSLQQLRAVVNNNNDVAFRRLCLEYMPLKFSRRHGDPSRPWNKFSINTRSEVDGSKILDYEGNWRDIFQNWEALAHAYPEFIENMIFKFLNASTFDGYNPYRVTKDGFDWEIIEPDDPWSYIGYWGDHQIIYLLKFLEFAEDHYPGKLNDYFDDACFVYANVPYKIKSYDDILKHPKDTIVFDVELDRNIRQRKESLGADATLLQNKTNNIHTVNFIEKILATLLAKLSNFIPEAGIWMNTQRPEWNDANNALVGNGVSMVTLYYIRRFVKFFKTLMITSSKDEVDLSKELVDFFHRVMTTLDKHEYLLSEKISDKDRKSVLDGLGQAGSDYRLHIYSNAFSGIKKPVALNDINRFIDLSLEYIDHTIAANQRADNLYHAYHLMTVKNENEISIENLSEMLEGQVAVLSSGYLSSKETLTLLDSLKSSALFREDQYSYILYPNKELPVFTEKNNIPKKAIESSTLLQQMAVDGNLQIIEKDATGNYHFNANFRNANDLKATLNKLDQTSYSKQAKTERALILQIFEDIFNHKAFTGRSGTFFGYEGLGSIYWHMVSKLVLAVQECCIKAIEDKENPQLIGNLLKHYYEINEGIGVHKSPALYGAFPTDPYSHTPAGKGVQQPGMTGQVKEDILSRFGELGAFVKKGKLYFNPCLLRKGEFSTEAKTFQYIDIKRQQKELYLDKESLCFTYCQVPVVYTLADYNQLEVTFKNKTTKGFRDLSLDRTTSQLLFERTGDIAHLNIRIDKNELR